MLLFYLLILVMPMVNHPFWGLDMGLGLTPVKLLGAISALYACAYIASKRFLPQFFHTWESRWFWLLFGLVILSYSVKPDASLYAVTSFISFGLLFFNTIAVVDSLRRLRWVLISIVASIGLTSVYVVNEWRVYHNLYPGYRPGIVAGDSNYFASAALVSLPIAYFLLQGSRKFWERVLCLGCSALALLGLMLSGSRGGFLGLMVGAGFVVVRSNRPIRNTLVVATVLLPMLLLVPSSPLTRILHPNYGDEEGSGARVLLFHAGMSMIHDHPFLGVGIGNFKPTAALYLPAGARAYIAHDAYLEMAAELGLVGLVSFCAMLFSTYRTLDKVRKRAAAAKANTVFLAAQGLQAALLSYMVSMFFLSAEYEKLFWLMLFLTMSLPGILTQWEKTQAKQKTAGAHPSRMVVAPLEALSTVG